MEQGGVSFSRHTLLKIQQHLPIGSVAVTAMSGTSFECSQFSHHPTATCGRAQGWAKSKQISVGREIEMHLGAEQSPTALS